MAYIIHSGSSAFYFHPDGSSEMWFTVVDGEDTVQGFWDKNGNFNAETAHQFVLSPYPYACSDCPIAMTPSNIDAFPEFCGDGVVQGTEECDDGNTINGDGCENDCTFTPPYDCEGIAVEETCDSICTFEILNSDATQSNLCATKATNYGVSGCGTGGTCVKLETCSDSFHQKWCLNNADSRYVNSSLLVFIFPSCCCLSWTLKSNFGIRYGLSWTPCRSVFPKRIRAIEGGCNYWEEYIFTGWYYLLLQNPVSPINPQQSWEYDDNDPSNTILFNTQTPPIAPQHMMSNGALILG